MTKSKIFREPRPYCCALHIATRSCLQSNNMVTRPRWAAGRDAFAICKEKSCRCLQEERSQEQSRCSSQPRLARQSRIRGWRVIFVARAGHGTVQYTAGFIDRTPAGSTSREGHHRSWRGWLPRIVSLGSDLACPMPSSCKTLLLEIAWLTHVHAALIHQGRLYNS